MGQATNLLEAAAGDAQAAEQLLPLVYDELRRLAAARLAQERPGQTLQATADLALRGEVLARAGNWRPAANSLTRIIERDPSDDWVWYTLGAVLLMAGDRSAYLKESQPMLARFGTSDDARTAARAAKICFLAPSELSKKELAVASEAARRVVETGQNSQWLHWFELTQGLSLYRQGAHLCKGRLTNPTPTDAG